MGGEERLYGETWKYEAVASVVDPKDWTNRGMVKSGRGNKRLKVRRQKANNVLGWYRIVQNG